MHDSPVGSDQNYYFYFICFGEAELASIKLLVSELFCFFFLNIKAIIPIVCCLKYYSSILIFCFFVPFTIIPTVKCIKANASIVSHIILKSVLLRDIRCPFPCLTCTECSCKLPSEKWLVLLEQRLLFSKSLTISQSFCCHSDWQFFLPCAGLFIIVMETLNVLIALLAFLCFNMIS